MENKVRYTECPECMDVAYNEERGHIVTFDHFFAKNIVKLLTENRDDIHIAIDVSEMEEPYAFLCYHITWRRHLPKGEE